jgi:hypothetical protein
MEFFISFNKQWIFRVLNYIINFCNQYTKRQVPIQVTVEPPKNFTNKNLSKMHKKNSSYSVNSNRSGNRQKAEVWWVKQHVRQGELCCCGHSKWNELDGESWLEGKWNVDSVLRGIWVWKIWLIRIPFVFGLMWRVIFEELGKETSGYYSKWKAICRHWR